MKINKWVILLILLLLMQSCASINGYKSRKENNENKVFLKINEFLYGLNKRKQLKKKRISYHLNSTGEYKNILEEAIVREQTQYGYIVINRSYISALDMEQDINNNESTLQGVDIVIIAKRDGLSIVLKAITVENENLLTMNVVQLERGGSKISYIKNDKSLKYYDAIDYCRSHNKNIPNENDVHIIEETNLLFWTNKYTKNSNMAMIYDSRGKKFFEGFRSDTFDVVCMSK